MSRTKVEDDIKTLVDEIEAKKKQLEEKRREFITTREFIDVPILGSMNKADLIRKYHLTQDQANSIFVSAIEHKVRLWLFNGKITIEDCDEDMKNDDKVTN